MAIVKIKQPSIMEDYFMNSNVKTPEFTTDERSFMQEIFEIETPEYQPRFNRIERARLAMEFAKGVR